MIAPLGDDVKLPCLVHPSCQSKGTQKNPCHCSIRVGHEVPGLMAYLVVPPLVWVDGVGSYMDGSSCNVRLYIC